MGCCGLFQKKPQADAEHGRVMVPPLNRMVSYKVVQPSSGKKADDSQGQAPCLLTAKTDEKAYVMWNVDLDLVKECFENDAGNALDSDPKTPAMQSHKSNKSVRSITTTVDGEEVELFPAYNDGQSVEYFSLKHKRWIS